MQEEFRVVHQLSVIQIHPVWSPQLSLQSTNRKFNSLIILWTLVTIISLQVGKSEWIRITQKAGQSFLLKFMIDMLAYYVPNYNGVIGICLQDRATATISGTTTIISTTSQFLPTKSTTSAVASTISSKCTKQSAFRRSFGPFILCIVKLRLWQVNTIVFGQH